MRAFKNGSEVLAHYPQSFKTDPGLYGAPPPSVWMLTLLLVKVVTLKGVATSLIHFHAEGAVTLF